MRPLRSLRETFQSFSHAARRAKGGGNGREDGDYDVEDLAPESVVVEGSHFVLDKKITEYRVQIVNRLG